MRSADGDSFQQDLPAIALGCVAGLAAGAGLGGAITLLLGGFSSGMWMFVMPHSMLSMMVMGGWCLPSLMSQSE